MSQSLRILTSGFKNNTNTNLLLFGAGTKHTTNRNTLLLKSFCQNTEICIFFVSLFPSNVLLFTLLLKSCDTEKMRK